MLSTTIFTSARSSHSRCPWAAVRACIIPSSSVINTPTHWIFILYLSAAAAIAKNNNPLEEKQKQPIWERTTTTHWDFQRFLSFFSQELGSWAGVWSQLRIGEEEEEELLLYLQIFTEFDAGWSAIAVAAAVIDEIAGVVLDEVVHHSCQIVALAASDAAGGGRVGGGHTHPAAVVEQQLFGGLRTKISATSSSRRRRWHPSRRELLLLLMVLLLLLLIRGSSCCRVSVGDERQRRLLRSDGHHLLHTS